MPKKIPITKKREWLNSYEKGKPEAAIAKDGGRSPKTVKDGIEWARQERYAAAAQAEIVTDALRSHRDQLLDAVRDLLSALVIPDLDLSLGGRPDGTWSAIQLPGFAVTYDQTKGLVATLDQERTLQWDLLREHLKGDRLWKALDQWKKAMVAHIKARRSLWQKARLLLKEETHLDFEHVSTSPPHLYFTTVVDVLYKPAMRKALGLPAKGKLVDDVIADQDNRRVMYGIGRILADVPGAEDECRKGILSAAAELLELAQIGKVTTSLLLAEQAAMKPRQALEEILLLGMVPGNCRVCRRLGI